MNSATHAPASGRDTGRSATASAGSVWWRVAAVVSVLTTFVLYVVVSRTAVAPRTPWDENGVLQMARIIAGQDVTAMSSAGYHPGWSFVLAPIWLVTDDARTVYQAAIALVILTAMATLWPLTLIGRRLGLGTAQALTAAAIVTMLPGRAVNADYVLSETFLMWCLAWTVVAVLRYVAVPTAAGAVSVSLAASAAYLTHARALALLATVVIWWLLLARRRTLHAVAGIVTAAVGYLLTDVATALVTAPVLLGEFGQDSILVDAITTTSPGLVLRVAVNQAWVQVVGTLGLVALGGVLVLRDAWGELRSRSVGSSTFVLGATVSAFLLSVLWWSSPRYLLELGRFDSWVYSRYNDPLATIVCLVAVCAIIRVVDRRVAVVSVAGSAALSAFVVVMIAPHMPTWGTWHGPANSAALMAWVDLWPTGEPYERPMMPSFTNDNSFWLWASVVAVLALVVVVALRRRPLPLVLVLATTVAVTGFFANPSQTREPPLGLERGVEAVEEVSAGTTEAVIDFDMECAVAPNARPTAVNWSVYWFSPRTIRLVEPSGGDQFDGDVVVACADWPAAEELGARAVKDARNYGYRAWVLPGPAQDRLAQMDRLGPVGSAKSQ